jgi:hypothetical protein
MDIYMFKGAFLCSDCTTTIRSMLMNQACNDSDEYPQGPYDSHTQESDSPCHCDCCQEFLEVGLTDDGREYVKDAIKNAPANPATQIWADYYELGE